MVSGDYNMQVVIQTETVICGSVVIHMQECWLGLTEASNMSVMSELCQVVAGILIITIIVTDSWSLRKCFVIQETYFIM